MVSVAPVPSPPLSQHEDHDEHIVNSLIESVEKLTTNGSTESDKSQEESAFKEMQSSTASGKSKSRKKETRTVETLLKSMTGQSAEEKLSSLAQKFAETLEENKTLQNTLKVLEKKCQTLQREKDHLQTENSKSLLARSSLEGLCRELQRQNKTIKEESLSRAKDEEDRRKEVSSQFQATLAEVSALLQQNNEKNSKLREENTEMANKLKILYDQYSLRDQHLEKLVKQHEIESQLNEARLAKCKMEAAQEKEKSLREKQQLLLDLTEQQKKYQTLQQEEIQLRGQLTMYTDKYEDFQKALAASNETFVGFKDQMDKMTKKLKSLEKETASWKQRWEGSNKALLEMAADKQKRDMELISSTKQIAQLDKLCRALQAERVVLLEQLKKRTQPAPSSQDSTIEAPPLPSSPVADAGESQTESSQANE